MDSLLLFFNEHTWKKWQYVGEKLYLTEPSNFAFILKVDWFYPFKHLVNGVGLLYMVLMNLPQAERFKI